MSTNSYILNPPPVFSHKGTQRDTKKKIVSKPSQLKSFGRSRNPFSKGFLAAGGKSWWWILDMRFYFSRGETDTDKRIGNFICNIGKLSSYTGLT